MPANARFLREVVLFVKNYFVTRIYGEAERVGHACLNRYQMFFVENCDFTVLSQYRFEPRIADRADHIGLHPAWAFFR